MPAIIHMLEANVDGLNYELHFCDICVKEQSPLITQLKQQIESLKKQAMAAGDAGGDEKEPAKPPAWVKANLPIDRKRKKPGRKKDMNRRCDQSRGRSTGIRMYRWQPTIKSNRFARNARAG